MVTLEEILNYKKTEIEERKSLYPLKLLERSMFFESETVSLKSYILKKDKSGIIAEFKRQSPSKGLINPYAKVEKTTIGYMQAGASALSVLTDTKFFGGKSDDLITARKYNYCPILRKDFIIDEYQVIESKSIGADAVLLIASALQKKDVEALVKLAKSLNMEVILEIHEEKELDYLVSEIDIVGINNRNLKDFSVDIHTSYNLVKKIPKDYLKISESGISKPCLINDLRKEGFDGFLLGEVFMKSEYPEKTCMNFIKEMYKLGYN